MLKDPTCFQKAIVDHTPHYVIHTACPFFDLVKGDKNDAIKSYTKASQLLAREAVARHVKRVVVTGAATSVIGVDNFNQDGIYSDATKWATNKFEGRPNELGKFSAEKACWNEVIGYKTTSPTQMNSLLPYFICGPPIYKESFNSSC